MQKCSCCGLEVDVAGTGFRCPRCGNDLLLSGTIVSPDFD